MKEAPQTAGLLFYFRLLLKYKGSIKHFDDFEAPQTAGLFVLLSFSFPTALAGLFC
ncbi:MAG: hypothetical protein ACKOWO_02495 [Sediminibacterium sp.]